ncbi:type II secretion system protein GspM [Bradyrhizobium sp. STM 3809]|uniref:type II secretion system protein GspM n=1 Tax=Bradyrhizobium sp. STM 3809 TaxID=551936 RepID=UPI00024091FE|nr:type II secretion system protein GspM [Bradyrhizobium sp. STM 3809]CCE00356.1 putative General secretion pathway protein M [Bradyrhizobium sp. STM 3809]
MSTANPLGTPSPRPTAALLYAGLLLVLIAATVLPAKSLLDQRAEIEALTDTLRLLDAHSMAVARRDASEAKASESAFLEGPTVTVAGAALLQRLGEVVARHGGSTSSSQVDVLGPRANDGQVRVTTNFEAAQPALQPILYDLEAGMPCLFIDELVVDGSAPSSASAGKLRVTLTVSGQWQGPQ